MHTSEFFSNGRRTAGRIGLKFYVAYGAFNDPNVSHKTVYSASYTIQRQSGMKREALMSAAVSSAATRQLPRVVIRGGG